MYWLAVVWLTEVMRSLGTRLERIRNQAAAASIAQGQAAVVASSVCCCWVPVSPVQRHHGHWTHVGCYLLKITAVNEFQRSCHFCITCSKFSISRGSLPLHEPNSHAHSLASVRWGEGGGIYIYVHFMLLRKEVGTSSHQSLHRQKF